jgi:hypothetical protein
MANSSVARSMFVIGVGGLQIAWFVLLISNRITMAVEVVRGYLPSWFPTVNLVLTPLLIWCAAGPSPISLSARFAITVLAFCSFSALYLAYATHPGAFLAVLALIGIEVFLIIPAWNARRRVPGHH